MAAPRTRARLFCRSAGVTGGRQGLKDCIEQCTSHDVVANCSNAGVGSDGKLMRCCDEAATLRYRAQRSRLPPPTRSKLPSACRASPDFPMQRKRYYLKYTTVWTPDVGKVVPVVPSTLRVPHCELESDRLPARSFLLGSTVGGVCVCVCVGGDPGVRIALLCQSPTEDTRFH